mmetsp:Transcript_130712/g.279523  ORF Transcript_130712/g.279523 Transcript_130712/m.279523 type:complete len:261 (+) Transcript_130712:873-1655(+)
MRRQPLSLRRLLLDHPDGLCRLRWLSGTLLLCLSVRLLALVGIPSIPSLPNSHSQSARGQACPCHRHAAGPTPSHPGRSIPVDLRLQRGIDGGLHLWKRALAEHREVAAATAQITLPHEELGRLVALWCLGDLEVLPQWGGGLEVELPHKEGKMAARPLALRFGNEDAGVAILNHLYGGLVGPVEAVHFSILSGRHGLRRGVPEPVLLLVERRVLSRIMHQSCSGASPSPAPRPGPSETKALLLRLPCSCAGPAVGSNRP